MVSAPALSPDWRFDEDNRHEQVMLNTYLLAVASARICASISSSPLKSPGEEASNKGPCQAESCTRRTAGKGKKYCRTCTGKGGTS